MIPQITKRQSKSLEALIRVKKEDDDLQLTEQERILELFMPIKPGIRRHGLTANEITQMIGKNENSHRDLCGIRVQVCNLMSSLIADGFPFGGVKDGRLKKYGFSTESEFMEIEMSRKQRMLSEIKAGTKYLEEDDPMLQICNNFTRVCDNQLKLFDDSKK